MTFQLAQLVRGSWQLSVEGYDPMTGTNPLHEPNDLSGQEFNGRPRQDASCGKLGILIDDHKSSRRDWNSASVRRHPSSLSGFALFWGHLSMRPCFASLPRMPHTM